MVFSNNLLFGAAAAATSGVTFDTTLIGNSIWVDGSGTSGDAMTRTWGSESNQDRWIWATWYNPSRVIDAVADRNNIFASGSGSNGFYLQHTSTSSTFIIFCRDNAGNEGAINTSEFYRDVNSWYHILVDFDSANGTANDRISLYVNGVRVGAYSGTAIGQNNHLNTNVSGQTARIGQDQSSTPSNHMQGYLAQTVFLDNKSIANGDLAITDFLDTFTFGTNGSQRIPKSNTDIIALASAAGTNSFCLDYSDSSNIVDDASTKGNDFTPTGGGSPTITSANQSSNTPSLTYPLLNPLSAAFSTPLSNGNTTASGSSGNGDDINPGIIIPKTGKWVWQITNTTDADLIYGVRNFSDMKAADYSYTNLYGFYSHTGDLVQGASPSGSYLDAASGNDVYQIYYNAETRKMWVSDNGTIPNSGDPDGGTNEAFTIPDSGFDLCPTALVGGTSPNSTFDFGMDGVSLHANGQTFKPLTSKNLPTPDYQGIDYFDATIYEGNGTGQRVGDFVPFTNAYTVTNSVMLDDGDSRDLTLNSSATRTSATVAAFSLWTKRANLGTDQRPLTVSVDGNNYFSIYYGADDKLDFTMNNGGATILQRITTRTFKDNSAWHNIVVIINQGESTQADRVKVFYDGVQIPNDSTGFGTNTCTLDGSSALNFLDSASAVHDVGGGFSQHYDGYVAEVAFLDGADSGAKLNASDFGQVDTSTNRWVPKDIGSYDFGNTGYYLEFKVAPGTGNGAGTDTSGESNNFTSNGSWATTDQFTDTPSKNYPIVSTDTFGSATPTVTEGRLKVTGADNGGNPITMQPTSGKWYFEVELDTANAFYPGLITAEGLAYTGAAPWSGQSFGFFYFTTNPNGAVGNGGTVVNGYNASGAMSSGDRLGIAWDVDNNLIYFGSASSGSTTFFSSGNPAAGTGAAPFDLPNERLYFVATHGGTDVSTYHFISSGWEGAAPTGFSELNQDNLDDTASKITAWAWIKNRDATDDHILVDRVRGVGKVLSSNDASAEATNTNTIQRFFQRGVQVGSDAEVNTVNESYVLWQWLLGDSATTGSSITTGSPSLTTTGIVADADHFSIISYTGSGSNATVAHGLSAAPEMYIVRDRTDGNDWNVYHENANASPASGSLRLDSTAAFNTDSTLWNGVPTASLINLGSSAETNELNKAFIAYCFRSVSGVCKVGSYIGNGSSTAPPYVTLGFKPRWVMLKNISVARDWVIVDTARTPTNTAENFLFPNLNIAEAARGSASGSDYDIDILAEAFLPYTGDSAPNGNGNTIIYVAMAEIGGNGTLPPIYGR